MLTSERDMDGEVTQVDVKLILGDCLEVLKDLPAGSVDAVVTDPPYGIGLSNNDRDGHRRASPYTVAGDSDALAGNAILLWAEAAGIVTVTFASPWRPWSGNWRNLIVWDKGGAVGGGGDIGTCLKRSWELVQVARNGAMSGARAESVWRFPITPRDTAEHICAKPVALLAALITRFVPEDATVLDPFMGSGTTGVACVQTGRNFIGIEIDPTYYAIAERRIAEAQQQLRMPL